ncbi:MAG: polysaccharide biosynthesis/export family protein [Acidobacteriota bacterium]
MNRLVFACAVSALALAGFGCAGPSQGKPTAKLEDILASDAQSQQQIKSINDSLLASVSSTPQAQDCVIGEGDRIQVTVFEAPELKTETRVGARGFATLPLIGQVGLKGLTVREAEQKIEDTYRQKFLQDPHVGVFVLEQVSGRITLLGALRKSGTFPYLSRQRLLDVLALSEGLSDKAGRTVQVRRAGEDNAPPSTYIIDLDELIKNGKAELNLEIKGGDVIYVPEAGVIYVDGAVRKPGNISITQRMSVQEAIVAAGGLSKIANEGNIKLVRTDVNGKREIVQVSMADIEKGGAQSLLVKDRDVIFVEANAVEKFIYGLNVNVLGLVGVSYNPPDGTGAR